MTPIERFKLFEPDIPHRCIEKLETAAILEANSRRLEAVESYENVLAEFGELLSLTSHAEILISIGHLCLSLKFPEKSQECVVSIMDMPGLRDLHYGRALVLQAFIEASKDRRDYERALMTIDAAEKRYNDEASLELTYSMARHTISLRKKSEMTSEK